MEANKYYDGTKLLSLQDINGNRPELYMCTTNRTGGKTTYFSKYLVNKFLKKNEKFVLIYRFNYELDDVADKFFKDIGSLFFPEYTMTSKRMFSGIYHELFINKKSCGYAIALNGADQIKKNSHLFSDACRMFFDEFQSETNHYCIDEVKKFISIHTSLARGHGKQVKYLPVYMCANPVSIINPYYVAMGITSRLDSKTVFLRGNGFVLEQGFVESAMKAQKTSGFNQAFSSNSYVSYSGQGVYLNDNKAFIEKMSGKSQYLATIKYEGKEYAIREYTNEGIIYCDDRADTSFKLKITVSTDDHDINYVMLKRNDFFIQNMRYFFEKGCFRFKNLSCKEAILKTLSY